MADLGTFLTGDPTDTPAAGFGLVYDATGKRYRSAPVADPGVVDSLAAVLVREETTTVTSATDTLNIPAGTAAAPVKIGATGTATHSPAVSGGVLAPVSITALEARTSGGALVTTVPVSPALALREIDDSGVIVRDSLAVDGTLTRRTGALTIDGDTGLSLRGSGDFINTIGVFTGPIPGMKSGNHIGGRSDRFPVGEYLHPDVEGIQLGSSNDRIYLRVARSRLATQDLAGVKAWLAANPVTIHYELAVPATSSVDLSITPVAGGTVKVVTPTTPLDLAAEITTSSPADVVQAVNGKEPVEGAVSLTASDVGADPAGTAQGLIDNLELPGAEQIEYQGRIIEAQLTEPVDTSDGTLPLPESTLDAPLSLTISGAADHTIDAANGGTLAPVSFSTVTTRDSEGVTVDTATYAPTVVLRDLADDLTAPRDTLTHDGTLTRHVGTVTLNGSEAWTLRTSGTFTNTIGIQMDLADLAPLNDALGRSDRFPVSPAYLSTDAEGIRLGATNNRVYLRINRSRLATQDLAGALAWLAANPTTIWYQKAAPVTEQIAVTGTLTAQPGGSVVVDSTVPARVATRISVVTPEYALTKDARFYTLPTLPAGVPPLHTGVHADYDALMAEHPDYITSTVLGYDALGNELREYVFSEPTMPNQYGITKPKLGITTGVHGNEKGPVRGLFRFLTALSRIEGDNEMLRAFRAGVNIRIIPVVNPSGYDLSTRNNHNGVNINRNYTTAWDPLEQDPGTGPASELETQVVESWLAAQAFDYFADLHWTNQGGTIVSWAVVPGEDAEAQALRQMYSEVITKLSVYWPQRYPGQFPKGTNFGNMSIYSTKAQTQVQAYSTGARSMLVEVAGPVTYLDTSAHGAGTLTVNSEIIGNTLLAMMRDHY